MTKHQNNKEMAILEAARNEFLEKGYDGARTTSIAKSAGVTHAMLHYYFKTKEQLFTGIFDDFIHQVVGNMTELFNDSDKPFIQQVEDAVSVHFDFIKENPQIPLFVIREIATHPERIELIKDSVASTIGGFFGTVQKGIDQARINGEICDIDAINLLFDVLSLNAFTFLARPIFFAAFGRLTADDSVFIELRKQEILKTIHKRLAI